MFRETQGTCPGVLERVTTTKAMPGSSMKPTGHGFVNGSIPSHLRRRIRRSRYSSKTGAQAQQQRMSGEGRSAGCMDELHGAKVSAGVRSVGAVGVSEHLTAVESMPASSSTEVGVASAWDCEASSCNGVSVRVEGLMKARSEYASAVEFEVEASKVHWSEVADGTSDDDDENGESDVEVFARLQKTWGRFFRGWGDWMEVGEKIAEGSQAEIFEGDERDGVFSGSVLKVMKEGYRLRDLEKQWPLGMLRNQSLGGACIIDNTCLIHGGGLLKNGRFAFSMMKYWGDLRKLIDMRMQLNKNQRAPFTDQKVRHIVQRIADGMEGLHAHKIVHRDLKASNVLISFLGGKFDLEKFTFLHVDVADFECSVGVVGTGYWRAPEILQAVQQHDIKHELFTEKSDVYAFGMTCYEVLTGCIPFEELDGRQYDIVIEGGRPKLPKSIDLEWVMLLNRCWHMNPLERPSFVEIRKCLKDKYWKLGGEVTSYDVEEGDE